MSELQQFHASKSNTNEEYLQIFQQELKRFSNVNFLTENSALIHTLEINDFLTLFDDYSFIVFW